MKKKKLNFNACLVANDAADVINALTEGLKEKCLHFQKGNEELLLELDEAVTLSIEARYKDGKAKVTMELVWDVPQKETLRKDTASKDMVSPENTETACKHAPEEDGLCDEVHNAPGAELGAE